MSKAKKPEKIIVIQRRAPAFDLNQLPSPKDPLWRDENNRFVYEEDLRMYLYSVMDKLDSTEISPQERRLWDKAVDDLGKIAEYFAKKGYKIHIH
jgi:hypothetical protein